ncbi:sensor histidine kinase [Nocardioides pinisoli]|uniref:histidine kinase n=1 Tax=Nocardioides pinisoli TaxID=2950279 RepID=A0ABT1KXV2_9ACTN|nr:histidine kinase [Nocardioides pinisoli]MCP3422472.1 histidine kinase [Nocardioides pinisoli]
MLTRVRSLALSVWRLPAAPGARPPGRIDHAFVAAVAVLAVVEVVLVNPDLDGRWLGLAAFLVWLPSLLVRRTMPLVTAGTFVVVAAALGVVEWTTGSAPADLGTAIVALLIPYSLVRWATGKDAVLGLALFAMVAATSLYTQDLPTGDRIGGISVIVAAVALGIAVRARSMLHTRQLDDVRRDERERLARDLHDTVAHHLTAIAISAQAGLAVAEREPGAATDALRRIDEEATRTLAETRKVLRVLRTEDDPRERPLADLRGLASGGPGPVVAVAVDDDLDDLSPTIAAALQRIAQEAVANARRHARDATLVQVRVVRQQDGVELEVTDDGRGSTGSGDGFGIIGMTERATLLGGHLEAGPRAPLDGWRVTARLPLEVR